MTAGDDAVVKVFNFRQRKLLFSLSGHLDYVRSVAFHNEAPWIVSASDDQTVRIWNWQSRQCVAVLSGHNHYVMCAAFHPTEDLLVSGSLDQTIRVWDLSSIRSKNAPSMTAPPARKSSLSGNGPTSPTIELFAGSGLETSVKFIMEGHDRGVNWVQFHPSKPFILSGSDDRSVKIWRYNDVRAWEVDSFRGHSNNVSCVLWHPRSDVVISDAEDRQLRVWDCAAAVGNNSNSRGRCLLTIKRDHDRFWCLAAHPELNIFAAGHDNGLMVFKLERERPAFTLTEGPDGDVLYYVRDRLVRCFALDSGQMSDEMVAPIENPLRLPASVAFSPTERCLLAVSNTHLESKGVAIQLRDKSRPPMPFVGAFATFVGRNRFVTLTQQGIMLQSIGESGVKQLPSPAETVNRLLPGPLGTFLAVTSSCVYLMDGTSGRVVASLEVNGVKYASWSANYEHCALMAKKSVHLTDKSLSSIHYTHHDSTGIKSGAWDASGPGPIFYYTNSFHLKYLLPQGDSGIICTTATPLYLVRVKGDLVHVLDRQLSVLVLAIDPTECHFKMALHASDSARINHIIQNSNLVGQAVIAYLRDKGHAEIALQFVKDPSSRFDLAIECCDLSTALEAAQALNDSSIWNRLAKEALLMGDLQVAKEALKLAKNQNKSDFMALITGNLGELSMNPANQNTLLMNAIMKNDSAVMGQVFADNGMASLAYLAAGGKGQLPANADLGRFAQAHPVASPQAMNEASNWPLLFDPIVKAAGPEKQSQAIKAPSAAAGWGADDLDVFEGDELGHEEAMFVGDDLDIPLDEDDLALLGESQTLGTELFDLEYPAELPLAASQAKPVDAESLISHISSQNNLVILTPVMTAAVERIVAGQAVYFNSGFGTRQVLLPAELSSLDLNESEHYDQAMQLTTQGKFAEALSHFRSYLQLSAVAGIGDAGEFAAARNYVIALMIDLERKRIGEADMAKAIDLAVLFTRSALKPEHHLLSLRAALALAYKAAAYRTAALIARRIVAVPAPEAVHLQARKVLAVAEKANYSEAVEGIQYGSVGGVDGSHWEIDPVQFVKIDSQDHECLFCGAKFASQQDVCRVCEIGSVQ